MGPLGIHASQVHDVTAKGDVEFAEKAPANGPCGHACGGLPGRCPLQDIAGIAAVVLKHPRQIDMARPWPRHLTLPVRIPFPWRRIHDLLPILPIAIVNYHGDRRAERLAPTHAGEELDVVGLDLHPSAAAVALLAARQIDIDVGCDEGKSRHHSLQNRHQRDPVRFARRRKSEHKSPKVSDALRDDNPLPDFSSAGCKKPDRTVGLF